ncbi:hypothetical protein [Methylobacterium tarhaniae]|uniref:hypothetical protein n=1 Tax=Methylobacterium tarhaniae TaxID=1187852 RepID=UPI000A93A290|nr:hypothetical protein [Methylobacterium tarhaniae]
MPTLRPLRLLFYLGFLLQNCRPLLRNLLSMSRTAVAVVLALATASPRPAAAEPLPSGRSDREVAVAGRVLRIAVYRPDCRDIERLIVVFHGSDQNPMLARDNAVPIAEAGCALLVAPLFDAEHFGRWAYQFGGVGDVIETAGRRRFRLRLPDATTGALVLALVNHLRREAGRPGMPYVLLGHSAGAQFLSRFAALEPNGASRIVVANPGSHVTPDLTVRFPYGLGGIPDPPGGEAALQRYLAAPLVIIAAERDVGRTGLLRTPGAERQGQTRRERAVRTFEAARQAAAERGWAFGWKFITVGGLGHGSGRLYARPETAEAVLGSTARQREAPDIRLLPHDPRGGDSDIPR